MNFRIVFGRYRPVHLDLETELKAFIPDYIPAVGEVDAFIKPERPDGKEETLGLTQLVRNNLMRNFE